MRVLSLCVVSACTLMFIGCERSEESRSSGGEASARSSAKDDGVGYDTVERYYSGIAVVKKGKKFGFIDIDGTLLGKVEWDSVFDFKDGVDYTQVQKNGVWGTVNRSGDVVIEPEWETVKDGLINAVTLFFENGIAVVKKKGKFGVINEAGEMVVPLEWDLITKMNEGVAIVKKGGKYGLMDETGKLLTKLEYDAITQYPDRWTFSYDKGLLETINKDRKTKRGYKYGLLRPDGTEATPAQWDSLYMVNKLPLVRVSLDKKFGYIDVDGKEVIAVEWDELGTFSGGEITEMKKGSRYGLISKLGEVILEPTWDRVVVNYGFVHCALGKKEAVYNKDGEEVLPLMEAKMKLGQKSIQVWEGSKALAVWE